MFPDENPLAGSPVEAPLVETSSVGKSPTTTTLASSTNPSTVGQSVTFTATVSSTAAMGTVDFKQSGVTIAGCSTQPVSAGSAQCTVASSSSGWRLMTAVYSGDSNYAPSTSSPGVGQTVNRKTTTMTLASSLNPSTVGEAVTYTATLNTGAATGTVEFRQAGAAIAGCAAQPISVGRARCTVASSSSGWLLMTAVYSGDSSYVTSTSSPGLGQTVNKKVTTMTLASSLNPSTVGEAVTYTATLNTSAATGAVEFKQGGVTIAGCSVQPVSAGSAQCTVASSSSGWRLVTAVYSGDSNYATSTSSPGVGQTVNKKVTTMTLASSLNPSTVGEAVTYTATLNTGAATGTVEFREVGVAIAGCAAQPISVGRARCTVTNPPPGWRLMTAVYSGDSSYVTSTSSPGLGQTVNKKTTALTLSSSLSPSTVGEAVTYTATLNTTVGTGTVEFKQAGVTIAGCVAQIVSSGTATCTAAGLTAGSHWITAVYSGDGNYAASTSPGLTQAVNKKTITTSVSSSLDPSTVGQSVTYTATVSSVAATGTIEFQEEGTPITGCTAETVSSGAAQCTVTDYLSWSSYAVTAVYSGDSSYLASVSPVFTQTVEPPAEGVAPFRFFSPTSFWNEELPANAAAGSEFGWGGGCVE